MHFGGLISFMGKQIGGNFGSATFCHPSSSFWMIRYEGLINLINSLMPFFDYFEDLLSQNLENDHKSSIKKIKV